MSRHDHVSGRPRDYISEKRFYRGWHRPGKGMRSVAEITVGLAVDADLRGWEQRFGIALPTWNPHVDVRMHDA